MSCIDEGQLQAYLDDELSRDEKKKIMQHLESCATCREELAILQEFEQEMGSHFTEEDVQVDVNAAWETFENKLHAEQPQLRSQQDYKISESAKPKKKGVSNLTTKTKRWVASGVAAATIIGSLAFPQVQVAADQFLSLFRVDQVEMVKLTEEDMNEVDRWFSRQEPGTYDLKGLGEVSMSETTDFSERPSFSDVQKAKEAGYAIPNVNGFTFKSLNVNPEYTISFDLDIEKANNLLTQFGVDQQFDQDLQGQPFSLQVGEVQSFNFSNEQEQFIEYNKMSAPSFSVPKGVEIEELKDTMVELPFVPEDVKRQINQIQSIENTLPLPYIEQEGADLKEITLNNHKGYMVTSEHYTTIIWQQEDFIHFIEAHQVHYQDGSVAKVDPDQLKKVAQQIAK